MSNELESHEILRNLIEIVKLCQTKYCNKKELATENDALILKLCEVWEDVVNYGLRTSKSVSVNDFSELFKNVHDMVSGHSNEYSFWDFCVTHLSQHERDRFESLNHVSTNLGRTRALIRASLNEHSLQRYICMWLSDPILSKIYEPNALLIDSEATNLLPNLAAGLSTILFAITVDNPDLNIIKKTIKEEPIIFAPIPISTNKKTSAVKRNIVSFDDDDEVEDVVKLLDTHMKMASTSTTNVASSYKTLTTAEDTKIKMFMTRQSSNNSDINITEKSDICEYLNSLGGKTFSNDSGSENADDEYYVESESSSNFSKSTSNSALNASNNCIPNSFESQLGNVEKIKNLEEQLKVMTDRCAFLEARVADLSLENHRLQRIGNFINSDFGNYDVSIPKVNLIQSKHSKHYVYEIHITSRENESWIITKRYSAFFKLYQEMLKKHNSLVKPIDFPPKKQLGNMNISFVEERRQRLQVYLRNLIKILPEIVLCTSKEELENALPFFK